ncbi:flagellar biosynthesis anti-sigma factor FlgM [Alicyclobacillaceae bacterium I2511]|nr:flagellar biosynthesis anti-sigma factor FlgM [Alicyclobacillaceae bacterium I2511]
MQISPNGDFPRVTNGNLTPNPVTPHANHARLQGLKDAIANGTYQVNTEQLAQKMINAGVFTQK